MSDDLIVLACSLSRGHDEGHIASRELAKAFCERVKEAADASQLDRGKLAKVSNELLSSKKWCGWHLSFCVVECRDGRMRAFNCGVIGVALMLNNKNVQLLLEPQTLGRKLRRNGVLSVPLHLEHVGESMAHSGMLTADIEEAAQRVSDDLTVIVTAEPRIMECLSDIAVSALPIESLRNTIDDLLDSFVNPTRAFILWSPVTP